MVASDAPARHCWFIYFMVVLNRGGLASALSGMGPGLVGHCSLIVYR